MKSNNLIQTGFNPFTFTADVICPNNPPQSSWACTSCVPNAPKLVLSGWAETKPSRYIQYGYIEARIKFPFQGTFPFHSAFWTYRGDVDMSQFTSSSEIDIVELMPAQFPGYNVFTSALHKGYCPCTSNDPPCLGCNNTNQGQSICPSVNPNFTCHFQMQTPPGYNYGFGNWNVYGVEWTPTYIIWYLNGEAIRITPNPGIYDPVRIILSFTLDEGYVESLTTTQINSALPDQMYVDYVKVYQLQTDCSKELNICNSAFSLIPNKVVKKVTIGNGVCPNVISNTQKVNIKVAEEVVINNDFTIDLGGELLIVVTGCTE
jgi:beta-glucanase (GH16 family)